MLFKIKIVSQIDSLFIFVGQANDRRGQFYFVKFKDNGAYSNIVWVDHMTKKRRSDVWLGIEEFKTEYRKNVQSGNWKLAKREDIPRDILYIIEEGYEF